MTLPLFGKEMFGAETWSVSDLNRYVRQHLEADYRLQDVRVRGEISGFKAYPSGHWYFSLKDGGAQVSCVMWRGRTAHQRYAPRDGDAVEVQGHVTLYETRGQYQLDAALIQPQGEGALYAEFMRLKAQLEAEGLFDAGRKRPLPRLPRRIALVTSPAGAALRDLLTVLRRRLPLAEVIVCPTPVQGPDAPPQIVAAIRAAGEWQADVMIVARGGGSLEDLWAFNDERVVRAIARSAAPVVSGVGHETDFTLADFAADVRAPTPSAAAELVSAYSIGDLRAEVDGLTERLALAAANAVFEQRARLRDVQAQLRAASPVLQLTLARQRVAEYRARTLLALNHQLELARERHNRLAQALNAVNPLAVLARGYAIVRGPSGAVVQRVNDVRAGEALRVRVSDGEFGVEVTRET